MGRATCGLIHRREAAKPFKVWFADERHPDTQNEPDTI